MGLKGKDGTSMRQAVEGMKHFRNNIMNAFYFGLLMFAVAAVWLVWFKARSRQLPRLQHLPPSPVRVRSSSTITTRRSTR